MSNVLKSKYLLGVMIVGALVVAFSMFAISAFAYTHTTTLKFGMRSAQVTSLQMTLGVTPATGYFGPITLAAVKSFQASHGLTADGVVGPMTGAALSGVPVGGSLPAGCTSVSGYSPVTGMPCTPASTGLPVGCTSTSGFSPVTGQSCSGGSNPSNPSGPLQGGAGSITIDGTSDFTAEEVGEGEEDAEVLAFEVEADDESDVEITSIKVELHQVDTDSSQDLTDYAESISVWFDGEMVGEADAEDFSENSDTYSKSISLDGAIIRAGDTEEFTLAVTALNNLDSGDTDDDDWFIGVSSVRFEDGEGVVSTESETLAFPTDASSPTLTVNDNVEQRFDFGDFATSADLEMKISLSDEDDVNEAHVINVDASDDTDDVEVLSFEIEVEGDSDVTIDELPIVITTVGTHVSDAISSVSLWADGEELDSIATEDDDTSDDLTFTDLDFTIDAGDTVTFTVKVDINDLDATSSHEVADGDTIQVSVGAEANIEAEDESGEDVGTGDISGTAAADAHAIYDVGFTLEFVSATESKQSSDTSGVGDIGAFVIKYKVTAFDGDIAIDNTCVEDADGVSEVSTATSYTITNTSSNTASCTVTSTGDTENSDAFTIEEGQSETLTLTVSAVATGDAFAQVKLEAIGWGLSGDGGDDNVFDFNLPGDFETDPIFLNLP